MAMQARHGVGGAARNGGAWQAGATRRGMNKELKMSSWMERSQMLGTFGKYEMEQAATAVLNFCVAKGTWLVEIRCEDLKTGNEENDSTVKTGFLQLIQHQWLRPLYYDYGQAPVRVTQAFVDRLIEKKIPLQGLPGTVESADKMATWSALVEIRELARREMSRFSNYDDSFYLIMKKLYVLACSGLESGVFSDL
jgi:hypothetical protein